MLKFPTPNKSLAVVMGSAVEAALDHPRDGKVDVLFDVGRRHGTRHNQWPRNLARLIVETPCAILRDRRRSGTT